MTDLADRIDPRPEYGIQSSDLACASKPINALIAASDYIRQAAAVRAATLEEAAKVCEGMMPTPDGAPDAPWTNVDSAMAGLCADIADAIRALAAPAAREEMRARIAGDIAVNVNVCTDDGEPYVTGILEASRAVLTALFGEER